MKYVILIRSNPDPWGHPTSAFTAEGREIPSAEHERMDREFERLLTELSESGELVSAQALGDPAAASLYRWADSGTLSTDGPYAESKEQLAGFFLIDCATRARAEEVAVRFAGPGSMAELRPLW
jgi:hypothetical protein